MTTRLVVSVVVIVTAAFAQSGNPSITTGQYNTSRTSANSNEAILNTSNVNVNRFGKLFSWAVDGAVFAQPLYVAGVHVQGADRNVVYIATMHNSVYAFDSSNPGGALWKAPLEPSVPAPTANGCPQVNFTGPELGILSTPVIDSGANTIYAITSTPAAGGYVFYLHALDITNGQDRPGSPVQIRASVPGNGYDSVNGVVTLSSSNTNVQRTALLLANGTIYAGFGTCGPDPDPWHGWVLGYNAATLAQTVVFNSTPNGGQGGIWQSGRGLVADSSGGVYFTTGNATPNNATAGSSAADAALTDYPMRLVKLSGAGQFLSSYPPPNYSRLNALDMDFSSSGPLLIPGSNMIIAGGKDANMYLFNPGDLSQPLQAFHASTSECDLSTFNGCSQLHDIAFWNSQLYVWPADDVLLAFTLAGDRFNTTSSSKNAIRVGYPPAAMSVSGNGSQAGTGILWATTPDSILHAFDASNVATELWNSNQNAARDALPSFVRFNEPTIVNGRVYVGTQSNQVVVYGLLGEFTLSISPASQTVNQGSSTTFNANLSLLPGFDGSVELTVSGLPAGATASFSPPSLATSELSSLTITTSASTPTGTYNLIITGTGSSVIHTGNVSLLVTTAIGDTIPPQWSCCSYTQLDSLTSLTFSASDGQSGLKSITPVQIVNATTSIPSFPIGTNAVVTFSATESGWGSYVKFQLTDVAGNVSYVSALFFDPQRDRGTPAPFAVKSVTNQEGIITIVNGRPGLKNLRVNIGEVSSGPHIEVAGMKDGEIRVVDVVSQLPPPYSGTMVTLTPLGKPGGTATVVFANTPMVGP